MDMYVRKHPSLDLKRFSKNVKVLPLSRWVQPRYRSIAEVNETSSQRTHVYLFLPAKDAENL